MVRFDVTWNHSHCIGIGSNIYIFIKLITNAWTKHKRNYCLISVLKPEDLPKDALKFFKGTSTLKFSVKVHYLWKMQIWEVSSNTRRRTLPGFQIPRALKMLAFGSPFPQKALGIWNPSKVLLLVFELLHIYIYIYIYIYIRTHI